MRIEIWREGFRASGDSALAGFVATVEAVDLQDACDKYAAANPWFAEDYSTEPLAYWGCRLFDNEREARERFG